MWMVRGALSSHSRTLHRLLGGIVVALKRLNIYGPLTPSMMNFFSMSRDLFKECILDFLSVEKFFAENEHTGYATLFLDLLHGLCYEVLVYNAVWWRETCSQPGDLDQFPEHIPRCSTATGSGSGRWPSSLMRASSTQLAPPPARGRWREAQAVVRQL